jgi:hypothetical protein
MANTIRRDPAEIMAQAWLLNGEILIGPAKLAKALHDEALKAIRPAIDAARPAPIMGKGKPKVNRTALDAHIREAYARMPQEVLIAQIRHMCNNAASGIGVSSDEVERRTLVLAGALASGIPKSQLYTAAVQIHFEGLELAANLSQFIGVESKCVDCKLDRLFSNLVGILSLERSRPSAEESMESFIQRTGSISAFIEALTAGMKDSEYCKALSFGIKPERVLALFNSGEKTAARIRDADKVYGDTVPPEFARIWRQNFSKQVASAKNPPELSCNDIAFAHSKFGTDKSPSRRATIAGVFCRNACSIDRSFTPRKAIEQIEDYFSFFKALGRLGYTETVLTGLFLKGIGAGEVMHYWACRGRVVGIEPILEQPARLCALVMAGRENKAMVDNFLELGMLPIDPSRQPQELACEYKTALKIQAANQRREPQDIAMLLKTSREHVQMLSDSGICDFELLDFASSCNLRASELRALLKEFKHSLPGAEKKGAGQSNEVVIEILGKSYLHRQPDTNIGYLAVPAKRFRDPNFNLATTVRWDVLGGFNSLPANVRQELGVHETIARKEVEAGKSDAFVVAINLDTDQVHSTGWMDAETTKREKVIRALLTHCSRVRTGDGAERLLRIVRNFNPVSQQIGGGQRKLQAHKRS